MVVDEKIAGFWVCSSYFLLCKNDNSSGKQFMMVVVIGKNWDDVMLTRENKRRWLRFET